MDNKNKETSTEKDEVSKGCRLKELDLGKLVFEANGHKYFIESHISPARYKQMELLSIHLGFGQSYKMIFDGVGEAIEYLNETSFVDAAVCLHNVKNGIAEIEGNHSVILRYCAMFINRDDEDRRVVDDIMVNKKIEDWMEEGITQDSFFKLAVNMVNGLKVNYDKYTQDISRK